MAFKMLVLLTTFLLLQNGQTFRFTDIPNEEINEATVRMMQDVFIKEYPQAAIDKYISVVRQQYSQVPEEREDGNFESVVLLVEGALYRTEMVRKLLLGETRQYDVRSALERIVEASSDLGDDDWTDFNEKNLATAKNDLDKEFPSEVGRMIANMFTRVIKAETLAEVKEAAIPLILLSMDGARAVTNRSQTLPTKTI